MSVRNPPSWLQAGSHSAENDRLMLRGLVTSPGVTDLNAMKVTQTGSPSMNVIISAGGCFVAGSTTDSQGTYHVYNDAPVTLGVSTANTSNPRWDLIVARVYDAETAGTSNLAAIEVITGSPSSTPADPVIPANCTVLARIVVPANATNVQTANITDRRPLANGLSNTIICTSITRPSVPTTGTQIYETDTKARGFYNGTNWVINDTQWQTYTPVWKAGGSTTGCTLGAGGSLTGKYLRQGAVCRLLLTHIMGTSGFGGGVGAWTYTLPINIVDASLQTAIPARVTSPPAGGEFLAMARPASTSEIVVVAALDSTHTNSYPIQNTDGSAAAGTGIPRIAASFTWTTTNGLVTVDGDYQIL